MTNLKQDAQVAAKYITPRSLIILALVCVIGFAFCEGRKSAQHKATQGELAAEWTRNINTINAITIERNADSLTMVSAIGHANTARKTYAQTVARITLSPESLVPSSDVERIIVAANVALANDSTVHVAHTALTADLRAEVAVISEQRDIAVAQAKQAAPKWYNGWKAGAVVTLLAVIGLKLALK